MGFGPNVGNRSILGDPRSKNTQSVMNLKIKYIESFRPFAYVIKRKDYQNGLSWTIIVLICSR